MLRKKILPGNAIYYRDTRRNEQPPKVNSLESQLAQNIISIKTLLFYVCVDKRLTISGSVLFIDTQHNLAADRIQRPPGLAPFRGKQDKTLFFIQPKQQVQWHHG